ncbi:MAG: hypothetical protein ACRC2U_04555, partial [Aeromonas sp.]
RQEQIALELLILRLIRPRPRDIVQLLRQFYSLPIRSVYEAVKSLLSNRLIGCSDQGYHLTSAGQLLLLGARRVN